MKEPRFGNEPEPALAARSLGPTNFRAALKRRETHSDMRAESPDRIPSHAAPDRIPSHAVRLRLQRVDFQTISAIDQVAQTFAARIFVIFDIFDQFA